MMGKALSGELSCSGTGLIIDFNPIALRTAKTPGSFGHSVCNRVK